MLKSSEKEYEFLKKEASEIKDCITKYIGYIISVFAASGMVLRYVFESKEDAMPILGVSILAMLVITLFFDIVWYKFKSHNRHVGYIQLLSQEVSQHSLSKLLEKEKGEKKYLDEFQSSVEPDSFLEGSLFTWELVMSEFNNANYHKVQNSFIKETNKAKYAFKIPLEYKYVELNNLAENKNLNSKLYQTIDKSFFEDVIFKLYEIDEKKILSPLGFGS